MLVEKCGLGMNSGAIDDSQLSASAYAHDDDDPCLLADHSDCRYGPQNARLFQNVGFGAWLVFHRVSEKWIQVDLLSENMIHKIATQGIERHDNGRTTSYSCHYKVNFDDEFNDVVDDDGEIVIFHGN